MVMQAAVTIAKCLSFLLIQYSCFVKKIRSPGLVGAGGHGKRRAASAATAVPMRVGQHHVQAAENTPRRPPSKGLLSGLATSGMVKPRAPSSTLLGAAFSASVRCRHAAASPVAVLQGARRALQARTCPADPR